jgi:hypothetical protein
VLGIGSASNGRVFGASRRNSASSSSLSLDHYSGDVDTGDILLLGNGTFIASASSSGSLRSAVGAGILLEFVRIPRRNFPFVFLRKFTRMSICRGESRDYL